MAMFNSYVKLPEGNKPPLTVFFFFYHPFYDNYHQDNHNTVDGCEILRQLVDGQNPLITPMTFTTAS